MKGKEGANSGVSEDLHLQPQSLLVTCEKEKVQGQHLCLQLQEKEGTDGESQDQPSRFITFL